MPKKIVDVRTSQASYSDISNNYTGLNKRTPWKNFGKIIIVQEGIIVHGGKRLKKILEIMGL